MATKARADLINERGYANGWHAQELEREARRLHRTMAAVFRKRAENSSAFNVPATCTAVVGRRAFYKFKDGSTADFELPEK